MEWTAPFLATASNLVRCPSTIIELLKTGWCGGLGPLCSGGVPGGTFSMLSANKGSSGSGKPSNGG